TPTLALGRFALAILTIDEEHPVHTSIGDGSPVHHREPQRALTRANRSSHAIPREARPELGKIVGGVAPREHVEDPFERGAWELRVGGGATNELVEIVDLDGLRRRGAVGDDL